MNQITTLTDDADQRMFYTLADGSAVQMEFVYRPAIQRWSVSLSYGSLSLSGYLLCAGPNVLRQWRNLVPFGMAVASLDGQDPVAIDDFTTGRVQVFMIEGQEVEDVESQVIGAP